MVDILQHIQNEFPGVVSKVPYSWLDENLFDAIEWGRENGILTTSEMEDDLVIKWSTDATSVRISR